MENVAWDEGSQGWSGSLAMPQVIWYQLPNFSFQTFRKIFCMGKKHSGPQNGNLGSIAIDPHIYIGGPPMFKIQELFREHK